MLKKVKYFMGVDEKEVAVNQVADDVKTNEFVQRRYVDKKTNEVSATKQDNKVYDISRNRMKVVVHSPKSFDESEVIVTHLLENKPVILNLSKVDENMKSKVFDFCMGALCALKGHMIKIDASIFLLAPSNIDVTGDIKEELESKGMLSWL